MVRRIFIAVMLLSLLVAGAACGKNKNVHNPLAQVDSKQPDKVLFDRAMEAMKSRKYDVARLSLQTLINTYPDSEYVARAKLAIGDSWYAEGGSTSWTQAEIEYKDFQTFFPNMAEAAEAQLRIADIHYKQMEKPDRDYTHAKRAEEEYRQLLLQYPDSKLADTARKRLLEVQEVLAEREYRIGRFYYLRETWPAAIARLKSLTDTYPLYSQADEALFMLGQANEAEVNIVRSLQTNAAFNDAKKSRLLKMYEDSAAEAYSKIVTRYPAMPRFEDAKKRLLALDRPVPKPTEEAIAQNKAEMASRGEVGKVGKMWSNFKKRPEVAMAAATKVGDPTLVDPKQTDAATLVKNANAIVMGTPSTDAKATTTEAKGTGDAATTEATSTGGEGTNKVNVETVNGTNAPDNQPVPRSESSNDSPKTAPPQVNEAAGSQQATPDATTSTSTQAADSQQKTQNTNDDKTSSSSKEKKKKGLRKIIPF